MSRPSISVLVPCYNAAEFLADALGSVRGQSLDDFECLIVDDASTDGSTEIARDFTEQDRRFQLIPVASNGGVSAARNRALALAQGRWIALLDADDIFRSDRLEVLSTIGERERADLVVDEHMVTNFPSRAPLYPAFGFTEQLRQLTQEDFYRSSRIFETTLPLGYMKPLIRRDFLNRTGTRYDEELLCAEDFVFYANLLAHRPVCLATNFAGYLYRSRRGGALSRSSRFVESQRQIVDDVLTGPHSNLSDESRAALRRFRRDFDELIGAMPALSAFHRRDWLGLLGAFARRPLVLRTAARLAARRARRRVSPLLLRRQSREWF